MGYGMVASRYGRPARPPNHTAAHAAWESLWLFRHTATPGAAEGGGGLAPITPCANFVVLNEDHTSPAARMGRRLNVAA